MSIPYSRPEDDLLGNEVYLLRLDEPINISHDGYEDALAQDGDRCGICGAEFVPGEVVTAVLSGGTIGIKCADGESCHERTMEKYKV